MEAGIQRHATDFCEKVCDDRCSNRRNLRSEIYYIESPHEQSSSTTGCIILAGPLPLPLGEKTLTLSEIVQ